MHAAVAVVAQFLKLDTLSYQWHAQAYRKPRIVVAIALHSTIIIIYVYENVHTSMDL